MNRLSIVCILLILLVLNPSVSSAQGFDAVGARAKGMGGAQVAAVDDASAVYWNPAGLASGAYFSMVLDWSRTSVNPPDAGVASRQEGLLFALGLPALGITYYQLESTALRVVPLPVPLGTEPIDGAAVTTFRTQNLGATLVQSLYPGVAVGATLKYVKGRSGADLKADGDRDSLLSHGAVLSDISDRAFDADLGVMASGGGLKIGLTVRNLLEPKFTVDEAGDEVQLQRQARAGIAVTRNRFTVAADFDLTKTAGPFGDVREIALGAEARIASRAWLRGGYHVNSESLPDVGHTPAFGFGGSIGVTSSVLIDAQVTTGSDKAPRGWGVSGRFVF